MTLGELPARFISTAALAMQVAPATTAVIGRLPGWLIRPIRLIRATS